jgi:hypothetical protein
MARPRIRSANQFLLFSGNTTLGWQVIQRVGFAEGERNAEAGVWQRVYDSITHNHIGYQPLNTPARQEQTAPSDRPSCAAISLHEMDVNAGLCGQSRTAGLPERMRIERSQRVHPQTGKYLAAEDAIERTVAKVCVWKQLGSKKRDILRVWPR